MNEDAFLASLREDPGDELTWQALADFLDDSGQPDRAELLRLTRRMLPTPPSERGDVPRRHEELLRAGVRPVVVERTNSIGMRFALVPAGRSLMGSPAEEGERSQNEQLREEEITRPYWLGVYPVTQNQWRAVMDNSPSYFRAGGDGDEWVKEVDTDDFPVEQTSWDDAQQFLKGLAALAPEKGGWQYRLPTEAEWEHACRGGADGKYPFCLARPSLSLSSAQANFDGTEPYAGADEGPSLGRTCKVGSYQANPFGLYDMHGNVFEWCLDAYFQPQIPTGPQVPVQLRGERLRVCRGGCWHGAGHECRSATRRQASQGTRNFNLGFRVALVPSVG